MILSDTTTKERLIRVEVPWHEIKDLIYQHALSEAGLQNQSSGAVTHSAKITPLTRRRPRLLTRNQNRDRPANSTSWTEDCSPSAGSRCCSYSCF